MALRQFFRAGDEQAQAGELLLVDLAQVGAQESGGGEQHRACVALDEFGVFRHVERIRIGDRAQPSMIGNQSVTVQPKLWKNGSEASTASPGWSSPSGGTARCWRGCCGG